MTEYDSHAAREALAAVSQTRADMVRDLGTCPPWRHALFGAMFFVLIGSISISSTVQMATAPLLVIAVLLLRRSDIRRTGVFINGYRSGATLPVTLALVGALIAFVVAAMHMRMNGFSIVSKLALATLAFALSTWASVVWQRIFRRELMAGEGSGR